MGLPSAECRTFRLSARSWEVTQRELNGQFRLVVSWLVRPYVSTVVCGVEAPVLQVCVPERPVNNAGAAGHCAREARPAATSVELARQQSRLCRCWHEGERQERAPVALSSLYLARWRQRRSLTFVRF